MTLEMILLQCFSIKDCKIFHNIFVKNIKNIKKLLEFMFKPYANQVNLKIYHN